MLDRAHNGKSHCVEPIINKFGAPDILLDRQSRKPLYNQIARQMAQAIRAGGIGRGERLI